MKQFAAAIALALLGAGTAHAASTAYVLDRSDVLPDGSPYLEVTLTETEHGVDFKVQTLGLSGAGVGAFGIDAFAFNFASDTPFEIAGLADTWRIKWNERLGEFGPHDVIVKTGYVQGGELRFAVPGASLSDFDDFFTAHVDGFAISGRDKGVAGYFGGSTPTAAPVPAAVWLFGSGLLGLVGMARRGTTR